MNTQRRSAGFTLIEVMVAIVLMAVIGLIGWRGMDSVARTSTRLEADAEQADAAQRALDQFARDVAMRATVEMPMPSRPAPKFDKDGRPLSRRLLPAAMVSNRPPQGALRIEIVRRTTGDGAGHWQRIDWWREGSQLFRAAGTASSRFPLPAPQSETAIAVLDAVDSFELRAWEPGKGWRRLPDSGDATPAQGLEVTLQRQQGASPASYRRVMLLH